MCVQQSFKQLTPQHIRKVAKSLAEKELQSQKKVFQSWGILGDWDNAYTTMGKNIQF